MFTVQSSFERAEQIIFSGRRFRETTVLCCYYYYDFDEYVFITRLTSGDYSTVKQIRVPKYHWNINRGDNTCVLHPIDIPFVLYDYFVNMGELEFFYELGWGRIIIINTNGISKF